MSKGNCNSVRPGWSKGQRGQEDDVEHSQAGVCKSGRDVTGWNSIL